MTLDKVKRIIDKVGMKAFNEAMHLLVLCEKEGITYSDLRYFQGYLRGINEQLPKPKRINRNCPKCKKPVGLRPIKTPKGKSNLKGWKAHWFCLNPECLWEEYSERDTKYLTKKYGVVEWQMD